MEIYKYKAEQIRQDAAPEKRNRVVPMGLWVDEKTQKTLAVLEAMHKGA